MRGSSTIYTCIQLPSLFFPFVIFHFPLSLFLSQTSSTYMVHHIHIHLFPMDQFSTQLQDKLLLATESPVSARQGLEQDIATLRHHGVAFNNEKLLWMQFQLALLSEQQNLNEVAAALFKSVSSIIIRSGITRRWIPRAGFVICDLGYVDVDSETPEEHGQNMISLIEEQKRLIKEREGAHRNDLQFLKLQFELAEFCYEGSPSDKEEADSIYKHICAVAFTMGITDPRSEEDIPQCRLEDMPWCPKGRFDKTLFIL